MSILDRYILRSLAVNYLIALGTMLSLYVVLDMFVNMDEFTEGGRSLFAVIRNVADYYTPNLLLYFAQLSGVITLFACLAVLARMRKYNELTAVLASGVSLYRVARPVVLFGVAVTGLLVLDTEVLIPAVAHKLARSHDDVEGRRIYSVLFLSDGNDALLSAGRFQPGSRDLWQLLVLTRDAQGRVASVLEADRAAWEPPDARRPVGRWRLERGRLTRRIRAESGGLGPREQKPVTYPAFYQSNLSPRAIQMRQSEGWIKFLSLRQLNELQQRGGADAVSIIQTKHQRRTQPIVGLVLLLLGLPFFLSRQPSSILSDAGKCMVLCGLCYVTVFAGNSLRPGTPSALPAWIPIFVFGTLAVVLIDRVRT